MKAKYRGLGFNLSKKLFTELTSSPCHYCGAEPSQVAYENNKTVEGKKHSSYLYNGLDRVDNNIGYTKNNVVPCCKIHNEWKRAMPYKDFVNIIVNTANYLKRYK